MKLKHFFRFINLLFLTNYHPIAIFPLFVHNITNLQYNDHNHHLISYRHNRERWKALTTSMTTTCLLWKTKLLKRRRIAAAAMTTAARRKKRRRKRRRRIAAAAMMIAARRSKKKRKFALF